LGTKVRDFSDMRFDMIEMPLSDLLT
jgi:hypothetical protein